MKSFPSAVKHGAGSVPLCSCHVAPNMSFWKKTSHHQSSSSSVDLPQAYLKIHQDLVADEALEYCVYCGGMTYILHRKSLVWIWRRMWQNWKPFPMRNGLKFLGNTANRCSGNPACLEQVEAQQRINNTCQFGWSSFVAAVFSKSIMFNLGKKHPFNIGLIKTFKPLLGNWILTNSSIIVIYTNKANMQ